MERFIKQSLLLLGFIIAAFLIRGAYRLVTDDYSSTLERIVRETGLAVEIGSANYSPPIGASFSRVGTIIPFRGAPFPLFLDRAAVALKLAPLFGAKGGLDIEADLYDGKVFTVLSRPIYGGDVGIDVEVNKLQLGKHPWGGAVSADGVVGFTASGEIINSNQGAQLKSGALKLQVEHGRYAGGHAVYGVFKLPAVSELLLQIIAKFRNDLLTISKLQVTSSLGNVEGHGEIATNARQSGKFEAQIDLNDEGVKVFGGYLQLAAQGKGSATTKRWKVQGDLKGGAIAKFMAEPQL